MSDIAGTENFKKLTDKQEKRILGRAAFGHRLKSLALAGAAVGLHGAAAFVLTMMGADAVVNGYVPTTEDTIPVMIEGAAVAATAAGSFLGMASTFAANKTRRLKRAKKDSTFLATGYESASEKLQAKIDSERTKSTLAKNAVVFFSALASTAVIQTGDLAAGAVVGILPAIAIIDSAVRSVRIFGEQHALNKQIKTRKKREKQARMATNVVALTDAAPKLTPIFAAPPRAAYQAPALIAA